MKDARLVVVFAVISAIGGTVVYEITLGIVGVALPHMQGTFSATPDQIAWVLTSFTVGTTIMIGCAGWFASRFGRKRFFLFSIAGFVISTIMCGSVDSLAAEVFWRLMQGLLGAPLMPLGQAITVDAFPDDKKDLASSVWAMGAVGGVVTAPVLGGYLVEFYQWRMVFLITVPLGIAAFVGSWVFVEETERDLERKLDWIGFAALVVAVFAIQMGLSRGERLDWWDSAEVLVEFSVGSVALIFFFVRCYTTSNPFVPGELLGDRNFLIGAALFMLFGAVLVLPLVMLPLLLQQLGGYPVFTAGALLFPRGIGTICALIITGTIAAKTDARIPLVFGLILIAFANWNMSTWTADVSAWEISWSNAIQGFGSGITFVPNIALAFWTVSDRYRTEGLSFLYLLFYFGSAVGVACIFAFQAKLGQIHRAQLAENITHHNETFDQVEVSSLFDPDTQMGLAALSQEIDRQAQMIAYSNSFLIIAVVALIMAPLPLLVTKQRT